MTAKISENTLSIAEVLTKAIGKGKMNRFSFSGMDKGGRFFYMQAVHSKQQTKRLKEWYDLWFDEHKKDGYVAVTDFKRQYFYGSNDIERLIDATFGKKGQFISINAFDVDWENKVFSRETARLKQIRNIAIDLDQYKLGLTVDEVIDELKALILDDEIPEPNLVLISRGIQLFYTIDKGASPSL